MTLSDMTLRQMALGQQNSYGQLGQAIGGSQLIRDTLIEKKIMIPRGHIIVLDENGRFWQHFETFESAEMAVRLFLEKNIAKLIICTQHTVVESKNTVIVHEP